MRVVSVGSVLGVALLSAPAVAESPAQGFLYGLGGGVNQEIYRGFKKRIIPIPVIGYKGDRLTVFGPFMTYDILRYGNFTVTGHLAPRFAGFDASDSDYFLGMAKRKMSLDAGVGASLRQDNWLLEVSTLFDVLDNSNGFEAKTAISYGQQVGAVRFEPKFSVDYSNSNLVDYYYGVRDNEATATRAAYRGEGTINYSAGLSMSTALFFNGMSRLGFKHTWYGSGISNSPLTHRDTGFSFSASWSTMF
ncbi:MipA/OmpV family protein [Rheinheimera salexigens]|uniref:MltA-interacting MipA family protein n=1 Tax=Rheinheimera salexigens TaxID=1628148 RepID=A0A1E7Q5V2_9GAMM|nr:MipA/OmpV family protein [Rheinheimera salexigens]OEY69490.1 hypothetical protein BI198_07885 [Rheinheimera salexigens]